MLGAYADAGAVGEPQPAAIGLPLRDFEALSPSDALYAHLVHLPVGQLQQAGDALVAMAAEGTREANDGRRRSLAFSRSSLLRRLVRLVLMPRSSLRQR
jgi:hypothetical protein